MAIFNNDCEVGDRVGNPIVLTVTNVPNVPVVFAAAPVGGMGANLTPGQLVDTGNSLFGNSFAALAIILITMSLALPVRKYIFYLINY